MNKKLEQAILDTIAYFDIFDYPLTHFELHTFLYSENGKSEAFDVLENELASNESLKEALFLKEGFVGLIGREEIIATRQMRYIESHAKFRIVKKFVRFARHVPYVEFIAACNNLAFFNAKKNSDLDFFIVVKKGMVPVTRFLTVLITIFFFKRPSEQHHKDTVCLSFLVDSEHVNVAPLRLPTGDIYMSYWYATLQPMYVRSMNVYASIQGENRVLLRDLPNYLSRISTKLTKLGVSSLAKALEGMPWKKVVNTLYAYQLKKLPKQVTSQMNGSSTSVLISPVIFKTHTNDARENIYENWTKRKNTK